MQFDAACVLIRSASPSAAHTDSIKSAHIGAAADVYIYIGMEETFDRMTTLAATRHQLLFCLNRKIKLLRLNPKYLRAHSALINSLAEWSAAAEHFCICAS